MRGTFNSIAYVQSTYSYLPLGAQKNIVNLLETGALGGTGKVIILAADQWDGVHSPIKYADRPELFGSTYIAELAIAAQVNAVALHPQAIRELPLELVSKLNLLYKINMQDSMNSNQSPFLIGTVAEAVKLGCSLIGYTLNDSSQLVELQKLCAQAHEAGLVVVVWCYTRGKHLIGQDGKQDDTAYDAVLTLLRQAVAVGTDILKIKYPSKTLLKKADSKLVDIEDDGVRLSTFKTYANNRLVLISGGEAKATPEALIDELKVVAEYADGSAMGRNLTQKGSVEAGAEVAFKLYREAFGVEV
jgi:class I fructose-bisphosphate aldolase